MVDLAVKNPGKLKLFCGLDRKRVRAAGRATMGVKLLDLDTGDKVAAAMVIPPEDPKIATENGALIQ